MRHRKKQNKLSRPRAQRKALLKSLVRSLFIYEKIKTTPRKAKVTASRAQELITLAKKENLHARRTAFSFLQDHKLVKKLFEEIAPRFKDIPGGYTRTMSLGSRKGDGAKISILELTKLKEKEKRAKQKVRPEEAPSAVEQEQKIPPKGVAKKDELPKKGLRHSLKKIFKKEKDAL